MSQNNDCINSMWEEFEKPRKKEEVPKTEEEKWQECKAEFYKRGYLVITEWGLINFGEKSMKDVKGGENLTYDEYLDAQKRAYGKERPYFQRCYYEAFFCDFKGCINKIDIKKNKVCFEKIDVSGIYSDGTGFQGKENHVWMERNGFENYAVGDCLSFQAEVYRYLKVGSGKQISCGLRDAYDIVKIDEYELPTDEELNLQAIDRIICEVCMFNEHCYMGMCIASEEWRENMRKAMLGVGRGKNKI